MEYEFYLELIWFDVKCNLKRRMNSIFAVRLSIKMQNGQAIADKCVSVYNLARNCSVIF